MTPEQRKILEKFRDQCPEFLRPKPDDVCVSCTYLGTDGELYGSFKWVNIVELEHEDIEVSCTDTRPQKCCVFFKQWLHNPKNHKNFKKEVDKTNEM